MKLLHALLAGVLALGSLSLPVLAAGGSDPGAPAVSVAAPPDASAGPAAQPATPDELRQYQLRETQSPQVQDYAGGEVIVVVSLFGVLLFLLLVVIIADHHHEIC